MNRMWVMKNTGKNIYLQFTIDPPFLIFFSTKLSENIHDILDLKPYVELDQIHSADIVKVDSVFPPKSLKGDGLITTLPGVFLVIKVADCYPMYILDLDALACGVFHVGWRGLKAGIVENAVRKFKEYFGSDPENLVVVFGPGISAKHYEVGKEFKEFFKYGVKEVGSKLFFDIFEVAVHKLKREGVKEIYGPPYDTFSNAELFHSRRRDGEKFGLNRAIVGFKKELSIGTLVEESPYSI